jgi:drug/metabolite transporter (DMT)-like permease
MTQLRHPPAAASADTSKPLLAMGLVLGSTIILSAADAATKGIVDTIPALEIVWVRYVAYTVMAVGLLVGKPFASVAMSRQKPLQILRGVAAFGSATFFVTGLNWIGIADATSISFTAPLIVVLVSGPLLGERVTGRDWLAAITGFAGVLFIVQPGTAAFTPAAVFPLLSASCWACALVVTRLMSGSEPVRTTIAYTAITGLVLSSAALPFVWVRPQPQEWLILAAIGAATAIGHMMIVVAFGYARASLLAPLSYAQVVWAALFGFVFFATAPTPLTMTGTVLIAASGLWFALTGHRRTPPSRLPTERSR